MVAVTHPFASAKSDGADTTLVQPSNWNADHTIVAAATDVVLGRESAGGGAVEEIACTATGRSVIAAADVAAINTILGTATLTGSETLTGKTLTSPVLTTPQINDTSADHQYVVAVSELAADRTVTLPLLGSDDTFVFASHTQTLTGKTLGATTVSGQFSCADQIFERPKLKDYSEVVNAIGSIGGGTQDIDLEEGNVVTGTVDTSTTTFTFSNPPASGTAGSFTFIVTNGGSQTVNWPASVDWAGGSAPTLTTSGVDILTFMTVDGGTTWYGFVAGQDMS